jgi:hypothetical protein
MVRRFSRGAERIEAQAFLASRVERLRRSGTGTFTGGECERRDFWTRKAGPC